TLRLAAGTGLLVLSAFCGHVLLLPDNHRYVRLPLALFFWANAFQLLSLPASALRGDADPTFLHIALELIEVPLTMVQPLLLWLYVIRLTDDPTREPTRPRWLWHSLPGGFAGIVYIYILLLPRSLQEGLQPGAENQVVWQTLALIGLYLSTVLFYSLLPIYAVLILKRLRQYRRRLKDLFASTEEREIAWAWWLAAAVLVFWAFNLISIVASLFELGVPSAETFDSLQPAIVVHYVLMWSIALWGTRQRPGIVLPSPNKIAKVDETTPLRKYGKSGLNDVRLDRIASKIEALMGEQKLYLEPDLSLWDLAGRIGVTTHYASQALNEKLGERFFDYVNRWRIRDAADRLRTSNATILTIAYGVGFNSRSSFYTAFKRELGVTPSQYRAST
ncbi:helix-turn-helix transcriptional regulator, partial [Tateyamaria omphalii]|uniref:helix-turn-helix transcriptional regulator n=1 Tax=Tateyamaria omphalii TaxID=299262 RepID=UPI00167672CC